MASLPFLTSSYFVGELFIPNLTTTTAAGTANMAELQSFINDYEIDFLKYLLGDDLYAEFAAGIAVSVPAAKWTALKNKIYVITSGTTTTYKSPAANYVYYYYMLRKRTITTPSGEAKPVHENSMPSGLSFKQQRAWNKMVKDNMLIWEWLEDNSDTYDTFSMENADYVDFYVNQWGI